MLGVKFMLKLLPPFFSLPDLASNILSNAKEVSCGPRLFTIKASIFGVEHNNNFKKTEFFRHVSLKDE